jgi:guanylate kinase
MSTPAGKLVIISGPSGTGKTTVLGVLRATCPLPLVFSVSATTRAPREGEKPGVNYHFLSSEEFARRRDAGEFLECFEVFNRGHWYGTLWSEVTAGLAAGKWVLLEIDVQGARAVLERFPQAVTIFLDPSGAADVEHRLAELERRLRLRQTESDDEIAVRLEKARRELAQADLYRFRVINDLPDQAAARICQILTSVQSE